MLNKTLIVLAAAAVASVSAQGALVASDNGSNYAGGWTNGSNGGFGFGAWSFLQSGGGFKGSFIGDPANIGVTGMGSSAFALYANGSGSPTISAYRQFNAALNVGDSFTFQWGINWDGGFSGQKLVRLSSGNGTEITLLNTNSSQITVNGVDTGFGYGTNAMTWTFTQTTVNTVTVTANDRDGSGSFSTTISVTDVLRGFELRASSLADGNGNREPYFNNFAINSVPAPGATALLGVAGLVAARRRRA
jgi:hypothetical protein